MSNSSNNSNDYLSFEIENQLFGINLDNLNQIIETPELTKVPKSSNLIEGIIHHNNVVLPIVNFHKWLNLDKTESQKHDNILVLELKTEEDSIEVGLMVDKVLEVIHFEKNEIEKAPEAGDINSNYIRGIVRYNEKFMMLIDIENLFTTQQLITLKQSKESKTENYLEEITKADNLANIYLTFSLGNEKLAVDANKVVEILDVPKITPIPGSDDHMAGVVNIRGNILPVVDSRLLFNIEVSNKEITTVMVLDVNVNGEELSVGAIVDSVTDIIEIENKKISNAVSLDLPYNPAFLKGVAKVQNEYIQLINIDRVFELNGAEK